jgi:hypothetical protein
LLTQNVFLCKEINSIVRFTPLITLFSACFIFGCFHGIGALAQTSPPDQQKSKNIPPKLLLDTSKLSWQQKITPRPASPAQIKKRIWWVAGSHAAIWTGAYIGLNKAWYADYPRQNFHAFNDLGEWRQMDKAGHVWTAYQLARVSGAAWGWTGMPKNAAVWLGGTSALAFQSIIEIQDGFSQKWGFSWWDMAANTLGAGSYIAQELGWHEQRIQIKLGYWPYHYPNELKARRNNLFGTGTIERILKDYNSQTYWISTNLHSMIPDRHIPRWLNLALGYSSDLLLGGRENVWLDESGNTVNRNDIARLSRFYLSIDADLTRIPTRSKFLRSVFSVCNSIKIPAPSLELNSNGKLKMHLLHQ